MSVRATSGRQVNPRERRTFRVVVLPAPGPPAKMYLSFVKSVVTFESPTHSAFPCQSRIFAKHPALPIHSDRGRQSQATHR